MGRYFRPGMSKIYFLPAVANHNAPTAPEITAGTNLTPFIADPGDFSFDNVPIDTPDLDSTFTSQIPGRDKAGTPSIGFYDDATGATVRTALAKGVTGFIVRMPYGYVTTKRCEVFPVTSTGVNDKWSAGNDAAMFSVGLPVTSVPVVTAVLP